MAIGRQISTSSEAERWGLGVVQKFDSAALELYAQATFWSFEATELGEDQRSGRYFDHHDRLADQVLIWQQSAENEGAPIERPLFFCRDSG